MTILAELQVLHQTSPFIELYILDCTALGGSVYYFTPQIYSNGTQITWQSHAYTFIPIASNGWESLGGSTQGGQSQPTPQITISNTNKILLNSVVTLGNLIGAKVTRYRTYQKFLDGQSNADPTQFIGPDVFLINQKTQHTNSSITFQLINPIDSPGKFLPARQVLKNVFPGTLTYR